MWKKIGITATILYVVVSAYPTAGYLWFLLQSSSYLEVDRTWQKNTIPYAFVSHDQFNTAYARQLVERINVLVDSVSEENSFASNLPEGFAPYELRRFLQPATDPKHQYVLEMLDIRLDCGCPEKLDQFWLIRFVINPNDLSATLCMDVVRPWRSYIPQYVLMS